MILGESANLLSVGAVDFGIIVDSAVILVENIFRNFQRNHEERQESACIAWRKAPGGLTQRKPLDPAMPGAWLDDRLRLILISALQVDKAVLFSALITVAGFVPLFTMQGVEGQIFGPMARTYGYALAGALIATFTITPVIASFLLPARVKEVETIVVRTLHRLYDPALRFALAHRALVVGIELAISLGTFFLIAARGWAANFFPTSKKAISGFVLPCRSRFLWRTARRPRTKMREILLRHPEVITVVSQHGRPDDGSDASPFSNVELFAPLKPFDEWPRGLDQRETDRADSNRVQQRTAGSGLQFLAIHRRQHRGRDLGRQRRQFGQDRRPESRSADKACRAGSRPDEPGSRR